MLHFAMHSFLAHHITMVKLTCIFSVYGLIGRRNLFSLNNCIKNQFYSEQFFIGLTGWLSDLETSYDKSGCVKISNITIILLSYFGSRLLYTRNFITIENRISSCSVSLRELSTKVGCSVRYVGYLSYISEEIAHTIDKIIK